MTDSDLESPTRRMIGHATGVARILAWIGILTITVLSVVPAVDRPVTGIGPRFEHFIAFALVATAFAIGYRLSLLRLLGFCCRLFYFAAELNCFKYRCPQGMLE